MLIEKQFGLNAAHTGTDRYGLELEVEHIEILEDPSRIWETRNDGSLRNGGVEFVSQPLVKDTVQEHLERLFACIRFHPDSYSERTSIHVHCNMKGLEMDQLKSFCALYIIFEDLFFNYVDSVRHNNIFCVPLKDFATPERLSELFVNTSRRIPWEKYSALNILPLTGFGTVEFRHMHGNNNVQYITNWVYLIDCLKQAAKTREWEQLKNQITQLNNKSEYRLFAENVFGNLSNLLFSDNTDFKQVMHRAVMIVKLWLHKEEEKIKLKETQAKAKKIQFDWDEAPPQLVPGNWIVQDELAQAVANLAGRQAEVAARGMFANMEVQMDPAGQPAGVLAQPPQPEDLMEEARRQRQALEAEIRLADAGMPVVARGGVVRRNRII